MFPKGSKQYKILSRLNTPQKIQTYLDSIPFNDEENGETCMSVNRVLKEKKAHCLEGSFLACACLMLVGRKPIIVSLKARKPDYDHIVILFMENGYYGALSKTGHPVLSYRDPVYRSVRELVMSYFHEYFLFKKGVKTLVGYSKPINMKRFGTKWIMSEEDLWDIATKIFYAPVTTVVPSKNKRFIRKVPRSERKALDVIK